MDLPTALDYKTDLLHQVTPTLWLLEGVLMYLPEVSVLGIDGVSQGSILAAQHAQKLDRGRVVRHWQFGCDQPQELLARYGWSSEVSQPQDIGKAHSKDPDTLPITAEVGETSLTGASGW
ncbi:MAG: hypothetical protein LVS60_04050 [Nodosilinea sp. LVE1205-7]